MLQCLQQHVQFPTGEEEPRTARAGFALVAGFPNVMVAVDCTHVAMVAPRKDPMVYQNRHHFYSLNVQASCDHWGVFTDLVAKFPGSMQDAQIFTSSGLNLGPQPQMARGYPLLPYLLTPYQEDAPEDRAAYNQAHRATHIVIKHAFGELKMRFRCLHHTGGRCSMQLLPVAKLVAVCIMQHNIATRQCLLAPQELPLPNPVSPVQENVEAATRTAAQQDFRGHLNQECVRAHIWAT
ncbi:putative nuclease HARBI1 [Heteronotia binoei]|uniref:putative nuclease HARBI1 n=1 Tax=Heteronotia binoei TaxID=13085 RepID=UPI002931DA4A|nr:putative nuclease HARBI1 [Heteronotia binoei]